MKIELKRIEAELYEPHYHTLYTKTGTITLPCTSKEPLCTVPAVVWFSEDYNKCIRIHTLTSDAVFIRDDYTEYFIKCLDLPFKTVYKYHDVLYTDMFELPDGSRYLRNPLCANI